jgi:hypothetical protein
MTTKDNTKKHKKVNHMNLEELKTAKQNCLETQGGLDSQYGREIETQIVAKSESSGSVN